VRIGRDAYKILGGKVTGNESLVRLRTLEGNIKMDLEETGCDDGKWMKLTQNHVQWRVLMFAVLKLLVLLEESHIGMLRNKIKWNQCG
jgi:hypothetical protein